MTAAGAVIILWVVFSGTGQPLDARPVRQFEGLEACAGWVERYRQTEQFKADAKALTALDRTTALLCLPAGVRP